MLVEDEERYGVAELAEAADVSVRTVRYYIAEGLLPPAVTAGARSYYTREHLDRLRVIGRMKDAFLPLREIRRHLTAMDEEAIRQLADDSMVENADLDSVDMPLDAADPSGARYSAPPPPSASRFIYGNEDIRPSDDTVPATPSRLNRNRPGTGGTGRQSPASEYVARVLGRPGGLRPPDQPKRLASPQRSPMPEADTYALAEEPALSAHHVAPAEPSAWRRISLGDDAELLIREEAYHRRRDKIDWLIDWARKVLG